MDGQNAMLLDECIASQSSGILASEALLSDYTVNEQYLEYPVEYVEDTTTNSLCIVSSLIEKAWDELDKLSKLPVGWDSYSSPKISDNIIMAGKHFLARLQDKAISSLHVVPISGGSIQFEWQVGNRELELEFMDPNTISYLKVLNDEPIEEDQFRFNDFNTSRRIMRWLNG
jgi:hypothetical protein